MHQRLREKIIRQLGSTSYGELHEYAFIPEDLHALKTKIPNLAAMIHEHAQDGRKIVTVPELLPPSSPRRRWTLKDLLRFRKPSSPSAVIQHFPKPIHYASIIQPGSRVGELIGLRRPTSHVNGRQQKDRSYRLYRKMDEELTYHGESGTQGLAFWKHEGDQVHLLALDTWLHKVPSHQLLPLNDVSPIHYLTEIH